MLGSHSHCIGKVVVHGVDILRKAIGDPTQRCSVEKRHGRTQNPRHGSLEHGLAGVGSACRQDCGKGEHEQSLTAPETCIHADVCARGQMEPVTRPVAQPQAGCNIGTIGEGQNK